MKEIELLLFSTTFAVCRMPPDAQVSLPPAAELFCITRTSEELSIVCEDRLASPDWRVEPGWRVLKIVGPLDFALTGILAGLSGVLAARGISLFALSTFDTDYILVREGDLPAALAALRAAGYIFSSVPGA